MAKSVHNDVLDGAINIINDATLMTLCSAEPTTLTEATTTFKLADVAVSAGDFTTADGTTSGRKVTVAAKAGVPVDTGGTGTHIALCDGTRLLYVTTTTSTAVAGGGTVDIGSWVIEIADPS